MGNIELTVEKIKLDNDTYIEKFNDCRDFILKNHFSWGEEESTDVDNCETNGIMDFGLNEVERCLSNMKIGKVNGEDGWILDFIQQIFIANKERFTKILNLCLRCGYFPKAWKEARIALISKEGKDSSNYEYYRPICLLAVWEKYWINSLPGD
ncbi:hypothetical protein AVEN_148908-1 [Araneus ventricosus]|uniref:Reverse transcriptase domain-containing protein n=1 Tax=Araneus ventricosus TaxID=182803 RepID=A0A4Y2DKL7_ARAVE|nr:hypothetical protein AVEN_148908-1 [Araneus ventricosus]